MTSFTKVCQICLGYARSALIFLSLLVAHTLSNAQLVLVTNEEAALPAAPVAGRAKRAGVLRGPAIELVTPFSHATIPEVSHFHVKFLPRAEANVDVATVRVTYVKAPPIDLTPRLVPFVSDAGINVAQAKLPVGKHLIQVDASDTQGRAASKVFELNVGAIKN